MTNTKRNEMLEAIKNNNPDIYELLNTKFKSGMTTEEIDEFLEFYEKEKENEKMTAYAVIDSCGCDIYDYIFKTEEEALNFAFNEWTNLTDYDKKRRDSYCVAIVTLDEDGLIDWEIGYNTIKDYK